MADKPDTTADATQVVTPVRLTPGEKTVRLSPGKGGTRLPGERSVRLVAVNPPPGPDAPGERTVPITPPAAPQDTPPAAPQDTSALHEVPVQEGAPAPEGTSAETESPAEQAVAEAASIHSSEKAGEPVGEVTVEIRASPKVDTAPPRASSHAEETMIIQLPQEAMAAAGTTASPAVRPVTTPGDGLGGLRLRKAEPRPRPPAQRPLDALEPEKERRARPRTDGLGHAPWILALSSFGVVLVALGYAGGRYGTGHAMAAYWIGQVVVFTPVVLRLLSRRLAGVAESITLVLGLALNQYLLKWFYSPDQFRFPDELQHWLATTIINDTGELFRPNLALPPAVHFPGLAEMGAGVSRLTGLPVYPSGILVAGVAHLCFVAALFALVMRASGSPTIAGVSCVVYSTTLHYLFFNSMYLYQTAALPFFMITIWAVRRWRAGGGRPFLAIAVVGIGLTTVSHHVTAFALVATLVLLGVTEFVVESGRQWRALIAPGIAAVMVFAWVLLVARDVISYLEAPVDRIMSTASLFFSDHPNAATITPKVSLWQLGVQGLGLMLLLGLFFALARDSVAQSITRHENDSWRWSILIGTFAFFAGNGVRFLGSNGPEIAGRLATFTYVPTSVVAALVLVHATRLLPARDDKGRRWLAVSPLPAARSENRALTPRLVAGGALITILMVGARVGGWPPPSQLLPGPYKPAGFERAIDKYGVSAAEWEYHTLGPGKRVGGDITAVALASTYGREDPVRQVGQLYYDDVWSSADQQLVNDLAIGYLVVDKRIGEKLPLNQNYFEDDPHAGRIAAPLTAGQLGKFDTMPGVNRLYDNGTIRIYQMGGGS